MAWGVIKNFCSSSGFNLSLASLIASFFNQVVYFSLQQLNSSSCPVQSGVPSHLRYSDMHSPLLHRNFLLSHFPEKRNTLEAGTYIAS